MHTFRRVVGSDRLWQVGFCIQSTATNTHPDWYVVREFDSWTKAADFSSYLNGGPKPTWWAGIVDESRTRSL